MGHECTMKHFKTNKQKVGVVHRHSSHATFNFQVLGKVYLCTFLVSFPSPWESISMYFLGELPKPWEERLSYPQHCYSRAIHWSYHTCIIVIAESFMAPPTNCVLITACDYCSKIHLIWSYKKWKRRKVACLVMNSLALLSSWNGFKIFIPKCKPDCNQLKQITNKAMSTSRW